MRASDVSGYVRKFLWILVLCCYAINRHRSSHIVWAIPYKPVWHKLNASTAFGLHFGIFLYETLHMYVNYKSYIHVLNSTWWYSQRLLTRQKCNAMAIYMTVLWLYILPYNDYIYIYVQFLYFFLHPLLPVSWYVLSRFIWLLCSYVWW